MDLQETVGQQLMIGISGSSIDAETEKHLRDIKPGFIILFARNISSAGQVQDLVARLKQLVSPPPLIAVDQEGGRVIRFARDVTVFPGNMALGAAGSVELAFNQGFTSAMQLKALGIDINLVPVVDVLTVADNSAITTRSFGDNPERVSELALALSRGTRMAGVAAVAKHFPGMGAARVDPHLDLPAVSLSEDTFESIHRLPFRTLMADGINGIMSTHLCCSGIGGDGTIPATFSAAIVADYIRKRCGYDGLIFSDDLEMGAIARHHRIGDACLGALEAGHDVLLICQEYGRQTAGFEAVLHACERSAEAQARMAESLRRIAALRQFCATPPFANRQLPAIAPGELAETIAREAVTVISAGTVPLPVDAGAANEIHLIIPDLSSKPLLEDGYELSERHPIISACREWFPGRCTFQFFPMDPQPADVERIAATAAGHCCCILFLSDALGNRGQQDLIAQIRERCRHPLFVLLDNPFDHALIAPDETCITAYGSRKVQIQALAKVMFGKAAAPGQLPFRKNA